MTATAFSLPTFVKTKARKNVSLSGLASPLVEKLGENLARDLPQIRSNARFAITQNWLSKLFNCLSLQAFPRDILFETHFSPSKTCRTLVVFSGIQITA